MNAINLQKTFEILPLNLKFLPLTDSLWQSHLIWIKLGLEMR